MSGDDYVERRIADAFDAKARAQVGDDRLPPPVTTPAASATARARGRRRLGWLAPVAAAAAVVAVVAAVSSSSRGTAPRHRPAAGGPGTSHAVSAAPAASPVHVALKLGAGAQFGVGIPIIAYLSKKIDDGRAFESATRVTVAGKPVQGAWYFESSTARKGYPLEAHYRLQDYWPAHAKISMSLPIKGLSAGRGLGFDDNLRLTFSTGAANIATVDDAKHTLTLVSDGKPAGVFPVSLGAKKTPTASGTKVIMAKGADICMSGPGYNQCNVKWTQRLTYTGEYLHAAPWNLANLGRADTSNGCTNLSNSDAAALYKKLEIGDVVSFPDADGPKMTLSAGYGDWNVPWSQWLTGGAVPTR